MSFSLLYLILALLGLGLLIFIHELGHYFMARKVGMKVEAFGIGFGKPIYSWEWQGVKWNLCWFFFGGYVKIAGMDGGDGEQDPAMLPGSFFGKGPLDRIKVAFAGPLVNILFALILFTLLWAFGGREKNFSEFTPVIGWVDPQSELYQEGIRPGDEILAYNGKSFESAKDHLYAPLLYPSPIEVQGDKINSETGKKTPFNLKVKAYTSSLHDQEIQTIGVANPAGYVIYNPSSDETIQKIFRGGSPMENSGIQPGDRLVWVDGLPLFSLAELNAILNDQHVLLTVQHGQQVYLKRIPRVKIGDLKLDSEVKEELTDWQHEANLTATKFSNLYTIPYTLSYDATVENSLPFIDVEKQQKFSRISSPIEAPLEPGDKIIAVDGLPVQYAYEILRQVQTHQVLIIVERGMSWHSVPWKEANEVFYRNFPWENIQFIASRIGKKDLVFHKNNLFLLKPVIPKKINEFTFSPDKQELIAAELSKQKQAIKEINDPEKRTQAIKKLEASENQLMLGLPGIHDLKVIYNPNPFVQFMDVCQEIWHTLVALFSGQLSPKWMAGPIGIVQIVQNSWTVGTKEVLFWLGAISLNLGILNLLPIPVLDGGYICLFFIEMITGRRMKPQTLERLMIPFIFLVVGFFIYATYNDILRLITTFFR